MPQTPNSSPTPYLTIDELILFKDVRPLGMLAVDDGTQATAQQLETNQRIATLIASACGEIESALLASERYSTADLAAPNGNSQFFLKNLVADLAYYKAFAVRGAAPPESVQADYDHALHKLGRLSNGELILSFAEVEQAGVPEDEFLTPGDYARLNRFTDSCQRTLGIRNEHRNPYGPARWH